MHKQTNILCSSSSWYSKTSAAFEWFHCQSWSSMSVMKYVLYLSCLLPMTLVITLEEDQTTQLRISNTGSECDVCNGVFECWSILFGVVLNEWYQQAAGSEVTYGIQFEDDVLQTSWQHQQDLHPLSTPRLSVVRRQNRDMSMHTYTDKPYCKFLCTLSISYMLTKLKKLP